MIKVLANSLVPIFAGLLLGYAAGLRKIVDNKNVASLITFVMSFALPCSLFVAIAPTPHHLLWRQSKAAVVIAVAFVAVFALTYIAARILARDTSANSAVLALILGFPNVAGVGLPLLQAVYGLHSLGSAFWAPVLGVLAVIIDFDMPTYVDKSLTILGSAGPGTALFLTGLVVSAQRFNLNWGVGWSVFAKNLIQPGLCLAAAHLANLSIKETRYVVLISAIPCGFFGIVFGEGFNATPEVASSSLIASYGVGIFTLAGWIVLLSHLH
jgi:malonate transporter and related proteins